MQEYVVERVLGAIIYIFISYYFFTRMKNARNKYALKKQMKLCVITFTIMAFLYIPSKGADVTRLEYLGDVLSQSSWESFYNNYLCKTSTPLSHIYLRIVQSVPIYGLLPGVTTIICLSLFFRIISILDEELQLSNSSIAYVTLFYMWGGMFFSIVAGIRFILATFLVLYAMIYIWFKKKHYLRGMALVVSGCLIHMGMLPIAFFCLLSLIFGKQILENFWIKTAIIILVVGIIGGAGLYISSALEKYNAYLGGGASFGIRRQVLSIISFFMYCCFLLFIYRNHIQVHFPKGANICIFFLTGFDLYLISDFVMFARYQMTLQLFMMPYILEYVDSDYPRSNAHYRNVMILICAARLIISYLGDLSGLKFFVL